MRRFPAPWLVFVVACGSVDAVVDAPPADDAATVADASPDAPTSCVPSTTTCQGALLTVCDAQGSPTNTPCGFGCAPSADRCADLAPSNGLAAQLDQATTATTLNLTGNAVIDTSARTVTDGSGAGVAVQSTTITGGPVEILALSVESLSAVNITVRGSRALAILADGDVTITGTLSVGADFQTPGPGAITGTAACKGGTGTTSGQNHSGGGGGGFGSTGGMGGAQNAIAGGSVGATAGDASLVPLRGGCGGGTNSGALGTAGAGGGALQISARGRVVLPAGAFIAASGGGAAGWATGTQLCIVGNLCDAGGGGGAGGGILIEATGVMIAPTAGIVANGGSGHWGRSVRASNGLLAETPAPGTMTAGCANCPVGGNGAAGTTAATPGSSSTNFEGAGGGGGAGRIRINLPPGATFDPGPPIISPPPAIGAAATR